MSRSQPCPKCFRMISLPATSDSSAWVRCPLCGEEYRLQDALDFEPPALELITEPVASIPMLQAKASPSDRASDPSIDDIAEPNRAVLEGVPFDPDLPAEPDEVTLKSVAKAPGPAMMHADEDPLEAILEEALYDDTGKSAESGFAHMPEESSSEEPEVSHLADLTSHEPGDVVKERVEADPWDAPKLRQEEPTHEAYSRGQENHGEHPEPFPGYEDEDDTWPPKKKKKSVVFELVKILVGGVVGLAVGYAVLLWGFKIDPLGFAKMLPASILPEKLKATSSLANRPVPNTDVAQNNQPDTPPVQPDTTTPANNNVVDTPPADMPNSADGATPTQPQPAATDSATQTVPPPDGLMNNAPAGGTPTTTPPTTTQPADPFGPPAGVTEGFPPLPAAVTPTPIPEPEGPKTDKPSTLGDVSHAMTAADESFRALQSAPADLPFADLNTLLRNYYIGLAKLAESITLLRPQDVGDHDQSARSAAAGWISEIAADRARLEELGNLAGAWIDSPKRTQDGIVLAGTIQEIQPVGKQFRTLIKLFRRDMVLPVITTEKPSLANGDAAIVMGTIVKDPVKNLRHFDGTDDRVVWGAVVTGVPQSH
jgi:hypothetical protein